MDVSVEALLGGPQESAPAPRMYIPTETNVILTQGPFKTQWHLPAKSVIESSPCFNWMLLGSFTNSINIPNVDQGTMQGYAEWIILKAAGNTPAVRYPNYTIIELEGETEGYGSEYYQSYEDGESPGEVTTHHDIVFMNTPVSMSFWWLRMRIATEKLKRPVKYNHASAIAKMWARGSGRALPLPMNRDQKETHLRTDLFLGLAKLYCFATHYEVQDLAYTVFQGLLQELCVFVPFEARLPDVIPAFDYLFENTEAYDRVQKLVLTWCHFHLKALLDVEQTRNFIKSRPDFVTSLVFVDQEEGPNPSVPETLTFRAETKNTPSLSLCGPSVECFKDEDYHQIVLESEGDDSCFEALNDIPSKYYRLNPDYREYEEEVEKLEKLANEGGYPLFKSLSLRRTNRD